MADYLTGYAYCSPFRSVLSLDDQLTRPRSSVHRLTASEPDPETALLRSADLGKLAEFVSSLPPRLAYVCGALLDGDSQATIARRLGVSQAAVSKSVTKILVLGRQRLSALRRSSLMP